MQDKHPTSTQLQLNPWPLHVTGVAAVPIEQMEAGRAIKGFKGHIIITMSTYFNVASNTLQFKLGELPENVVVLMC